jgi:tRNA(fMet)-specific endonuclease VapC
LILDTNALSAIAEGEPGAVRLFSGASQVAVPVIVLGEYRYGIAHSRHKQQYEKWLEDLASVCRVLDINSDTAEWYARICSRLKEAGSPIPSNDAWIAALCRQHALPVMSHDRHFDRVKKLRRLDW